MGWAAAGIFPVVGKSNGFLGLGEAFLRVGYPPHGSTGGVTVVVPSLGMN